ncbi:hypothetical protein [Bradyrhizobium sp. sGM-13]|uniref:hypothetical protein n=1 Tax=Bradyrhizobium sp. sGM-13 TaxID=2831781 RepID=UPI001BCE5CC2|nr:hypothetical protein [Bradyrhizobium sp. sGM-13]
MVTKIFPLSVRSIDSDILAAFQDDLQNVKSSPYLSDDNFFYQLAQEFENLCDRIAERDPYLIDLIFHKLLGEVEDPAKFFAAFTTVCASSRNEYFVKGVYQRFFLPRYLTDLDAGLTRPFVKDYWKRSAEGERSYQYPRYMGELWKIYDERLYNAYNFEKPVIAAFEQLTYEIIGELSTENANYVRTKFRVRHANVDRESGAFLKWAAENSYQSPFAPK